MSAISSTPSPSTTKPIERTKSAPSTPGSTKAPKQGTPVDAAVDKARKGGGDAASGATAASKATDKVRKDPVNNAIIGAVDAVTGTAKDVDKNVRKTATDVDTTVRKTAKDVDSSVRKTAREVGASVEKAAKEIGASAQKAAKEVASDVREAAGSAAKAAKPLIEPTVREVKEAGAEIGAAASKVAIEVKGLGDLGNHAEVKAVRDSDLDETNKKILVTKELIENGVQGGAKAIEGAANVAAEVVEGALETAVHNPVNTAVAEGAKATVNGAKALGSSIGSWVQDRVEGGVKGAAKAGKTTAETKQKIADRANAQNAENAREVGGAADKVRSDWTANRNPLGHPEVQAVRDSDLDRVNKGILVAKEIVENDVQGAVQNVSNLTNLGLEAAEAGAENFATDFRNGGEAIAGGVEAAGNFLGGLFGR